MDSWGHRTSSLTDWYYNSSYSTDYYGNSTETPPAGPNVPLIVGLSVGIPLLLIGLGILLYFTRRAWLRWCWCCCPAPPNDSRQRRASQGDAYVPRNYHHSHDLARSVYGSGTIHETSAYSGASGRAGLNSRPLNVQELIDLSAESANMSPTSESAITRFASNSGTVTTPVTPREPNSSSIRVRPLPPPPSSSRTTPHATIRPPSKSTPLAPPGTPPQFQQSIGQDSQFPGQSANIGGTDGESHGYGPRPVFPKDKYPLGSPETLQNAEIAAEYARLRFVDKPCTFASSPQNIGKNRYKDTLPYDYNRVELSSGQYINASHIGTDFIVTQDPMMVEDDDDILWSMVWEKDIAIIVRLSADVGTPGNQLGSAPYMPVRRYVFTNCLEVKLVAGPTDEMQYVYRAALLSKTEGQDQGERHVLHYHLKNWNSYRPPPALDFLKVLCIIRERRSSLLPHGGAHGSNPRVLVHCGAGSSRSGTFIAVWKCMDAIDANSPPNVFNIVQDIREKRSQAVNKPALYEYIHDCANMYISKRDELNRSNVYDFYDTDR